MFDGKRQLEAWESQVRSSLCKDVSSCYGEPEGGAEGPVPLFSDFLARVAAVVHTVAKNSFVRRTGVVGPFEQADIIGADPVLFCDGEVIPRDRSVHRTQRRVAEAEG